ncbi:hypothetical protein Q7340_11450, partial [Glaesserella parasuis]|nr:hypothetical protein [Glaesserella parasuis]
MSEALQVKLVQRESQASRVLEAKLVLLEQQDHKVQKEIMEFQVLGERKVNLVRQAQRESEASRVLGEIKVKLVLRV